MTPPISFASAKLGYPLYELDFDPYSRGYLVVGGGGGGGNAGVPNKLTLVDVSSRASLTSVADLALTAQEDSVSSIASLATKDGLTTFAGVSSSVAERSEGRNEHFRSFNVRFPQRTRAQAVKDGDKTEDKDVAQTGAFRSLDRSRLFSPQAATGKYMNQKLLRLSPVTRRDQSTKRVGAIGSRDGEASEIAVFDATTQSPNQGSVRHSIDLEGKDAQDLDLWQSSEGAFSLGFCTNFSIRVQDFTYDFARKQCKLGTDTPFEIHKTTQPGVEFRCLRWVSPKHVLVACNDRQKKFSELLILTVDRSNKTGKVTARKRLPYATKNCNTMDVCHLDGDMVTGERQSIAAVAGSDGSIHIYALDYTPALQDPSAQIKTLRHFDTLKDVHSGNGICKVAFANFFPPQQPPDTTRSVASTPSYAKLASVAVFSDTVVVDSIALTSTPTSPQLTPEITGTQRRIPAVRWVLSSASVERMFSWAGLMVLAVVVFVGAFLLQGYANADPRVLGPLKAMQDFAAPGAVPPHEAHAAIRRRVESAMGSSAAAPEVTVAKGEGSDVVREAVERAEQAIPPTDQAADPGDAAKVASLRELLDTHTDADADPSPDGPALRKAVVVRPHEDGDGRVHLSVHEHDEVPGAVQQAKRFEELTHEQREAWKARLQSAGHWSLGEGEAVLKSILFSEYAAVVGGALRDAVLN